jgi:hypothetical protein
MCQYFGGLIAVSARAMPCGLTMQQEREWYHSEWTFLLRPPRYFPMLMTPYHRGLLRVLQSIWFQGRTPAKGTFEEPRARRAIDRTGAISCRSDANCGISTAAGRAS